MTKLGLYLVLMPLILWPAPFARADGPVQIIEVPLPDPGAVRVLAPPPTVVKPTIPPPVNSQVAVPPKIAIREMTTEPSSPIRSDQIAYPLTFEQISVGCAVIVTASVAVLATRSLFRRTTQVETDFSSIYDALMNSAVVFFPKAIVYSATMQQQILQKDANRGHPFEIESSLMPTLVLGTRLQVEDHVFLKAARHPIHYRIELQVVEGRRPGSLALQFTVRRYLRGKVVEYIFPPEGGVRYWKQLRNGTRLLYQINGDARAARGWMRDFGRGLISDLAILAESVRVQRENNRTIDLSDLPESILDRRSLLEEELP